MTGTLFSGVIGLFAVSFFLLTSAVITSGHSSSPSPIRFEHHSIAFHPESDETLTRHFPSTMAGGVAVLDYNRDGHPDLFFTNGAPLSTLTKDAPKFRNRLFRNEGHGAFTDVTAQSGLAGSGFDDGAAVADFDNDGYPDLFVAGVHRSTLYHNNGDGTFTDVTAHAETRCLTWHSRSRYPATRPPRSPPAKCRQSTA